jgi:hypothetical protein
MGKFSFSVRLLALQNKSLILFAFKITKMQDEKNFYLKLAEVIL